MYRIDCLSASLAFGSRGRKIEEQDIAILEPDPMLPPEERVRVALRRVADPEFLTTKYLSLRLQL
jgi:hypothetical protein